MKGASYPSAAQADGTEIDLGALRRTIPPICAGFARDSERFRGDHMATTNEAKGRPLSPHVGIWRWSATMATSIFHRATGIAASVGLLMVTWFLVALAAGPQAFATFSAFAGHWFGQLVLFGFALSIIYHLLNGVRHLVWDGGKGFGVATATFWSWFSIVLSVVLTLGLWYLAPATIGF